MFVWAMGVTRIHLEVSRVGEAFLAEMGRRIHERRKTLRLSQEQLAEKAEITKQTVSRIENGLREPGAGNLLKIAKALDVSADYLLSGEYTGADALILNQNISNLTSRQIEFLENYIKSFIEMCDEGIV